MNIRQLKRTSRRLYVRELLTTYGVQKTYEIPYHKQYLQFMVSERGCQESTAGKNRLVLIWRPEEEESLNKSYQAVNVLSML